MEIKLTGSNAIIVAALALGFVGFQYFSALSTLDTQGETVLKRWIGAEYQRYQLSRVGLSDEQRAQTLLSLQSLTLNDISARGTLDDLSFLERCLGVSLDLFGVDVDVSSHRVLLAVGTHFVGVLGRAFSVGSCRSQVGLFVPAYLGIFPL